MDHSKFKSQNNVLKTKALFIEVAPGDPSDCLYTLSPFDKTPYLSLYRLYLEEEDPSEFNFANKYFLGMPHWKKLCQCSWFQDNLTQMREDLQLKLKSRAVKKIIKDSENENSKNFFQANRYLADKGYIDKVAKGRPSKAEIKKEQNRILKENDFISNIEKRLN